MTEDKQPKGDEKEPIQVTFSLPQLAGGALAAATAAFLGSRLGVAGTIVGAAIASIIGGVGGTLYSAGIDRTHRKVADAIQRGYERVRQEGDAETRPLAADGGDTQVLSGSGTQLLTGDDTAPTDFMDTVFRTEDASTRADLAPLIGSPPAPDRRRRATFWQVALLTVGGMFLVALGVITAIELGLGQSLDGQGGTTVGQVVRPAPSASPKPTPTPSATATPSATPTASTSPTITTTPTPTLPQPSTPVPSSAGATEQPTPAASASSS